MLKKIIDFMLEKIELRTIIYVNIKKEIVKLSRQLNRNLKPH